MTPATAPPRAEAFTHRQVLGIFTGLMFGMLLASLDQTIVATALPTITGELGGLKNLSWVVTSYLLASTVSTPLYGKLGDLFGRKRLFLIAIVVFLAGSALCGMAQSMLQLIAFRGLQGLGAGGLIVLAQAIMGEIVPPRELSRYQGYFGALFGASSVAGPLLGGFLTDQLSWRWVFYVNLPLGAMALFVTWRRVPTSPRHGNPKIDWLGSTLLIGAVTCIVLVTTWGGTVYAWGSSTVVILGLASVILVTFLWHVERRIEEPMLPVHLFRNRTFAIASSVSFIIGVVMLGAISFLPLFLQVVNDASATSSGLLLLPFMLGLLTAAIGSGQIISRTGRYKVFPAAGCSIAAVGLYLLSTMSSETSQRTVTVYMVVLGVGIGFAIQTLILATMNSVSIRELGVATSTVSFFRSMGGSVGVALLGTLFNSLLAKRVGSTLIAGDNFSPQVIRNLAEPERTVFIDGFADSLTTVFLWATPLLVVGVALTMLLREVPLRSSTHAEPTLETADDASAVVPSLIH